MSDAYMCDRCGTFYEGTPELVITTRSGETFPWDESESELCGSCLGEMDDWWMVPKVEREG